MTNSLLLPIFARSAGVEPSSDKQLAFSVKVNVAERL